MNKAEILKSIQEVQKIVIGVVNSEAMAKAAKIADEQLMQKGVSLRFEVTLYFGGTVDPKLETTSEYKVFMNQDFNNGEAGRYVCTPPKRVDNISDEFLPIPIL